MVNQSPSIIGSNTFVQIGDISQIPAKIDTGADSSSIWVSDINVDKDGILSFKLFAPSSPLYTGETLRRSDYRVAVIRSSNGDEEIRYRTHISAKIKNHKIRILFSLADRSRNNFPILIGRRTLKNRFLVDIAQSEVQRTKNPKTRPLNQELKKDPYHFHQKYVKTNPKGV